MKTKTAIHILLTFLVVWCITGNTSSKVIEAPVEPDDLRLFLSRGYASAKSLLEDVRIEYEEKRILVIDPVSYKELSGRNPDYSQYTNVQEYIRKNGKERWVFLYAGTSTPTEDVSNRARLIGTINAPRFKVFDGQCILEYYPTKKDGYTAVGRATLDTSKTSLFEFYGSSTYAPVKFFGYYAGLLPDDVLSSSQLRIETKPEKIGNLLAYKVSAPIQISKTKYKITYWLSPERSCLPVKIDVERNGALKRRLETKGFIKLEDGRWAIESLNQKNFVNIKGKETPIELAVHTYTLKKLELHPQIDESKIFSTSPDSLPEGVDIIDKISGLRYFGGEGPVGD
jgi:hypothetical protein